jgi:hypothetical protein
MPRGAGCSARIAAKTSKLVAFCSDEPGVSSGSSNGRDRSKIASAAVDSFFRKLLCALRYKNTGNILPEMPRLP